MTQVDWNDEHIGKRVVYTGRNGNQRFGVIRGYAANMVDLNLDGSTRPCFYVPKDTIVLVPDDAQDVFTDPT